MRPGTAVPQRRNVSPIPAWIQNPEVVALMSQIASQGNRYVFRDNGKPLNVSAKLAEILKVPLNAGFISRLLKSFKIPSYLGKRSRYQSDRFCIERVEYRNSHRVRFQLMDNGSCIASFSERFDAKRELARLEAQADLEGAAKYNRYRFDTKDKDEDTEDDEKESVPDESDEIEEEAAVAA